MSKPPTVFVRDATGLVKNVSLLDAISMNAAWMGLGATIALLPLYTVFFPTMSGVNLVYGSIIGFLFVLPQMYIYTIIQRRMPRTGGDYVTHGGLPKLHRVCRNFNSLSSLFNRISWRGTRKHELSWTRASRKRLRS